MCVLQKGRFKVQTKFERCTLFFSEKSEIQTIARKTGFTYKIGEKMWSDKKLSVASYIC